MDDRDSNRSSSFEFEGNVEQPKEQTRNTTVSSEDLKAALKKPNTRTEQIAIAAEKTKGTARSLLDKSAKKINNIKSEKVRSAVIWGGGITALIVVVAVGILIGKAIHLAWLNNRTAETRAMIDSFNVEYNDIAILGASKEDKESFLSAVQEETKELESRDDENLWEMYMIEANAYFGVENYPEAIASYYKSLDTAPEIERYSLYELIIMVCDRTGDKDGKIRALQAMVDQDVFSNSKDPLAKSARPTYEARLKELKDETTSEDPR